MLFQEAKNLKIGNKVFIVGNDNRVYVKEITGINLRARGDIDITLEAYSEEHNHNGLILPHKVVYLKEKQALQIILDGYASQVEHAETIMEGLQERIKRLERIEGEKNHD